MKESKTQYQELQSELSNLRSRAEKAGYKNVIPQLKEFRPGQQILPPEHLMLGFYYRLDNWTKGLLYLENPGGMPKSVAVEIKPTVLDVQLEQLTAKFS